MKREFRDAWVAKLRSGEVEQGTGVLCSLDGRRCCLGVAYLIDDCGARISKLKGYNYNFFDNLWNMPTDKHLEQWGLDKRDASTLAGMNDDGYSFDHIANYIENKIPVEED